MKKRLLLAANILCILLIMALFVLFGSVTGQSGPGGCPQQETYSSCPTQEDIYLP